MNLLKIVALSSALVMAPLGVHAALDTTGADWVSTVAENRIDAGPASETLAMVDFLLCIMENSNSGNHVNETYGSMVDENICNGAKATSPAFASQIMTTSRASNTEPYKMKSWFTTDQGQYVVVDASITSAPTVAVPRGVATMTWNMVDNNGVGTGKSRGILTLTADATDNISYIEIGPDQINENTMLTTYIHGTLDGNGTAGRLRVKTQDYGTIVDNLPTPREYQYVFNTDSAHYKTGTTSTCLDRRAANMTKRVYGYKLFTAAGAEVLLAGPFDFRYTDSASKEQRGYADKWGVWLQGRETGNNRPTSITRNSNNKVYTACFDDDDDLNGGTSSCGTAGDEINYQLTHASEGVYSFADPILMVAESITDEITGATVVRSDAYGREESSPDDRQFAKYRGGVSRFDLQWQCFVSNAWADEDRSDTCDGARKWRQKYALEDGYEFTQQGTGTKYYTKAVDTEQTLAAHSSVTTCTDVSDLALSTAPASLGSYTVPDITGTVIWGTAGAGIPVPTAALKMAVIHGVEQ